MNNVVEIVRLPDRTPGDAYDLMKLSKMTEVTGICVNLKQLSFAGWRSDPINGRDNQSSLSTVPISAARRRVDNDGGKLVCGGVCGSNASPPLERCVFFFQYNRKQTGAHLLGWTISVIVHRRRLQRDEAGID